ncbi:low specificity L-threonine aldolase [Donghicola sp. C2-DW-16]|uniref:Low specificity L-threonine aldolase n=1 Tax=Donghicola mangrovi TaxID=2729614 RepID=A0ABX2PFR7_9RHOB|nr:beta-eliminating lyase-related protein [Donghicola mangrovi]NVO28233.1 low specificity L-threonine aldolase [Donghicola mangrovi]
MYLASDNTGPIHPQIMEALTEANQGYALPYGNDPFNHRAVTAIRELFEAPQAEVFFVPTGTSGNALALSTLCQPYQSVLCTPVAHIHEDECGAPEFYGVGKTYLVGEGDLMDPDALAVLLRELAEGGVHTAQPGAVSITSVTERGQVYEIDRIQSLATIAHSAGLPLHLDGARFANAAAALECTPAEMSWQAGVDVVTFGGTKSGCMGVEAVIFFNSDRARGFAPRRKRAGHLFSKNRFLAAQMLGYVKNDLWRTLGAAANARGQYLAEAMCMDMRIQWPYAPRANMLFPKLPRSVLQNLATSGVAFNNWGNRDIGSPDEMLLTRFVCDWSIPYQDLDQFLAVLRTA